MDIGDKVRPTPGPWTLQARRGGDKEIGIYAEGDGWHSLRCVVDSDDCDIPTAEANARLITAAPDLLKALEICRDAISDLQAGRIWDVKYHGIDEAYKKAVAAIRKAEGE